MFRYPSIGGLNSIQVGIIVNRVDGLEKGFYVYDPVGHALTLKDRGDMRLAIQEVTFESEWLFHAPIMLVLMHDENKVSWKYKTRGYRFSPRRSWRSYAEHLPRGNRPKAWAVVPSPGSSTKEPTTSSSSTASRSS